MSATKNWIHDYTDALDKVATTLEEATLALDKLGELLYTETGELKARVPAEDAWMLESFLQELKLAAAPVQCAKERPAPLL
jgi:hypothetical protein